MQDQTQALRTKYLLYCCLLSRSCSGVCSPMHLHNHEIGIGTQARYLFLVFYLLQKLSLKIEFVIVSHWTNIKTRHFCYFAPVFFVSSAQKILFSFQILGRKPCERFSESIPFTARWLQVHQRFDMLLIYFNSGASLKANDESSLLQMLSMCIVKQRPLVAGAVMTAQKRMSGVLICRAAICIKRSNNHSAFSQEAAS